MDTDTPGELAVLGIPVAKPFGNYPGAQSFPAGRAAAQNCCNCLGYKSNTYGGDRSGPQLRGNSKPVKARHPVIRYDILTIRFSSYFHKFATVVTQNRKASLTDQSPQHHNMLGPTAISAQKSSTCSKETC